MAPTLTRFAREGWTAKDVDRAAAAAMVAKGWRVVHRDLAQPAAYLATLLRDVDPADRPGAADEALAAAERAEREHRLRIARPGAERCPHGQPGGALPSPSGWRACPSCRASAAAVVAWPTVRAPGSPAHPHDA
ncbi:MAG: hypothetical protein ACLGI3_16765 [Actinomycetes bacterium]